MRSHIFRYLAVGVLIGAVSGLTACSGKSDNQKAQSDYLRSLNDSITTLTEEIDSCNNTFRITRENQDVWLRDFVTVSKDREAAPYMIFHSFENKYPPQSTGLIARLADNGQFELVASLEGARFDRITVESPDATASSDIVPADQALNYMAGNLNTVLFTGAMADSIGQLIANNQLNNITVIFQNGKPVRRWEIPNDYKKMIMASYQLYDSQKSMERIERRIPMLNRKIQVLREHKDKLEQQIKKDK